MDATSEENLLPRKQLAWIYFYKFALIRKN